ncbi:hypothetical protein TWF730_010600 [Orbilia blumenaviensis]|uniref:CHK kinase-like domain-containing protein n=1 Tax=Orbilia blumenaviensis TaxID=1796055 RepID=A0AAV9US54_9PEZI
MTAAILPSAYTLSSTTEICSLWSNYGSISRLHVSHPSTNSKSLILKSILPPPQSPGSSPDESHLRKLISYRVERYFYAHLSPLLSSQPFTKVAESIAVNDETGQLLLEDLSPQYPITSYGSLDGPATTAVLNWLAGFHGTFWAPTVSPSVVDNNDGEEEGRGSNINIGTPIPAPLTVASPTTTAGIWERGGYWYLSTRSSELSFLLTNPDSEDSYLIPWIHEVDSRIQNENPQWKTLIHGDPKGANILLSPISRNEDGSNNKDGSGEKPKSKQKGTGEFKAALYDFQYCGIATPAVDLVYFFGTTVDRSLLLKDLDLLLTTYYRELCNAYERSHDGRKLEQETGYSYDILKEQWDVAVVDWMRFMAGWGVWGNWRWVKAQAVAAVKKWEAQGKTAVSDAS